MKVSANHVVVVVFIASLLLVAARARNSNNNLRSRNSSEGNLLPTSVGLLDDTGPRKLSGIITCPSSTPVEEDAYFTAEITMTANANISCTAAEDSSILQEVDAAFVSATDGDDDREVEVDDVCDDDDDDDSRRRVQKTDHTNTVAAMTTSARELAASIVVRFYRGGGRCFLCLPDNSDSNRRRQLLALQTVVLENTTEWSELETDIGTHITNSVRAKNIGCLDGKEPTFEVVLTEVTQSASQSVCPSTVNGIGLV